MTCNVILSCSFYVLDRQGCVINQVYCVFFFFFDINTCYYTGFVYYIVQGGQVNPNPTFLQSEVHTVPDGVEYV